MCRKNYVFKKTLIRNFIRVVSNKTSCRNINSWLTTVPWKPLSFNNMEDIVVFLSIKMFNSNISENVFQKYVIRINHFLRATTNFKIINIDIIMFTLSDKAFKGSVREKFFGMSRF